MQPWKLKSCKAKMLEQNGSSQTKFTVALVRPKGFHQAGSGLPYFFIRQMLETRISCHELATTCLIKYQLLAVKWDRKDDQIQTVPQYRILVFLDHAKLDKCFHKWYTISYTSYELSTWIYTAMKYRSLQIKSAQSVYMSR